MCSGLLFGNCHSGRFDTLELWFRIKPFENFGFNTLSFGMHRVSAFSSCLCKGIHLRLRSLDCCLHIFWGLQSIPWARNFQNHRRHSTAVEALSNRRIVQSFKRHQWQHCIERIWKFGIRPNYAINEVKGAHCTLAPGVFLPR